MNCQDLTQTSSAGVPARLPAASSYTVGGRTVAFPMRDPYGPVVRTDSVNGEGDGRVVAGLDAWPERQRLGRRYYGLSGAGVRQRLNVARGLRGLRGAAMFEQAEGGSIALPATYAHFSGMGDTYDPGGGEATTWPGGVTLPPGTIYTVPPIASTGGRMPPTLNQPSTLQTILGTIQNILPATISAIKGKPYYPTGQVATVYGAPVQGGQVGAGLANVGAQTGAAVGNIGASLANFVATNPLLVLGGVVGVMLLMRQPPGRR